MITTSSKYIEKFIIKRLVLPRIATLSGSNPSCRSHAESHPESKFTYCYIPLNTFNNQSLLTLNLRGKRHDKGFPEVAGIKPLTGFLYPLGGFFLIKTNLFNYRFVDSMKFSLFAFKLHHIFLLTNDTIPHLNITEYTDGAPSDQQRHTTKRRKDYVRRRIKGKSYSIHRGGME